jgi:hypothetical protein
MPTDSRSLCNSTSVYEVFQVHVTDGPSPLILLSLLYTAVCTGHQLCYQLCPNLFACHVTLLRLSVFGLCAGLQFSQIQIHHSVYYSGRIFGTAVDFNHSLVRTLLITSGWKFTTAELLHTLLLLVLVN